MKLRLFFFLFSSLLIYSKNIHAQTNEFAPVGAKWWYSYIVASNNVDTAQIVEVKKDTIIDGKTCKVIIGIFEDNVNTITYQDDKKIYIYYPEDSTFKILMDFTKVAGEEYFAYARTFSDLVDSLLIHVVSNIDTVINGQLLKKQTFEYEGPFDWGTTNIEKLGNTDYLIPIYGIVQQIIGPLRCYVDDEIGLYKNIIEDCEAILAITDYTQSNLVKIYPIPFNEFINIYLKVNEEALVFIYSSNGTMKYNYEIKHSNTIINTEDLKQGIYFLKIIIQNQIFTYKTLKL